MRLRLTHSSSICGLALSCLLGAAGCGGNSGMQQPVFYPITIALSSATATIFANGVPPALTVTVIREPADTNPVTLAVSGCPSGVLPQITSPGTGSTGSIVFNAVAAPLPGNYPVTVLATEGEQTVSASLALAVQSAPVTVNVAVSPTVNTILGFGGLMETMMNTQFQAAEWAQSFFPSVPSATTTLANLHPQHIRVYTNSLGIPQRADKSWISPYSTRRWTRSSASAIRASTWFWSRVRHGCARTLAPIVCSNPKTTRTLLITRRRW